MKEILTNLPELKILKSGGRITISGRHLVGEHMILTGRHKNDHVRVEVIVVEKIPPQFFSFFFPEKENFFSVEAVRSF